MAEEPGGADESPDDAPESSSDSGASPPGDETDDPANSTDDAGGEESAASAGDAAGEESAASAGDAAGEADAGSAGDAAGGNLTDSSGADGPIPAIREVADDSTEEEEPVPAVREVADDASEVDGPVPAVRDVSDGDGDADSRTEVEYDASEAEELFSVPDPEETDDEDADDGSGLSSDLAEAYGAHPEYQAGADDAGGEADAASADDAGGEESAASADDAAGEESAASADDAAGGEGAAGADAPASDGGYADEFGGEDAYGHGDATVYEEDEWEPEGAPDDEEMPLADHIEEMVRRLGVVVVVMAIVSGVVFPFASDLINFLWFSYLPGELAQCPGEATTAAAPTENPGPPYCARVYHPLGLILARLKVATLVGFIVALPVFVYETYLFMRPGLFPHERRYYLASVPTSIVLAAAGVAFAHFLVVPAIFTYFLRYSEEAAGIAFGLTETFDLMVLLMGGFALVFQIPLFIMLALMMGLVTRQWLHDSRLLFWGAFAGIAFLFSPDPTGMAPIIVAVTMIVLFEGTLYLAKWTGRG